MSKTAAAGEMGVRESLLETSDNLEKLAIDLLGQCYSTNQQRTHILLIREVPVLGNVTCIEFANKAKALKFLSSNASKSLLDEVWGDKNYGDSLLEHIQV